MGPRPVLLAGQALFFVASALAAVVTSLPVLIACRVVQAAAGAALAGGSWAFVRYELRRPDAVLAPRLFTRRSFVAAAGGIALANMALYVPAGTSAASREPAC